MDEKKLESVNYRELCQAIIQELNEIERNWRNGKFKKIKKKWNLNSSDFQHVVIGKDWIACIDNEPWSTGEKKINFHSRTSLVVQRRVSIPRNSFAVMNTKIIVTWDKKNVKILDINGRLISEVPELNEYERISWNLALCCISGDRIVVLSQTDKQQILSLWDVSDPLRVTRLESQYFNLDLEFFEPSDPWRSPSMKMDDEFITIFTFQTKCSRFYFFSMKTLNLQWQKTLKGSMKYNFVYEKGMFLLHVGKKRRNEKCWFIDMYDVTSGERFREIRTTASNVYEHIKYRVGFNSKFMAFLERNQRGYGFNLNIYDLEAVKNKKSNDILVSTLDVDDMSGIRLMMEEREIFCFNRDKLNIFNFGSFERFRNEAKSVTLSLPWRGVWRSKGVDEEPLEPLHHMKVYKEVLKYFNELSMNCQTASKTCSVDNVDLATFTIGDDFIGYRRGSPESVIFDENMDKSCQEMYYKTVQTSKTTHLSVTGKTIQLTDSTTSKVINEMKLERNADEWYFNYNLLVCVHNIAEHEHLLSVWRIENSSNLNHIKDVFIEDYDGSLQVDDNFIAVETAVQERAGTKIFNFISMKTFQVERSLSYRVQKVAYDNGFLFLQIKKLVRILDVASGTFLRDIPVERRQPDSVICSANSNYVVVLSCNNSCSKLNVYDLKCLKETDAVPSYLLLTSIELPWTVIKVAMNETRIVCLSYGNLHVVYLKHVDRLRCPEYKKLVRAKVNRVEQQQTARRYNLRPIGGRVANR